MKKKDQALAQIIGKNIAKARKENKMTILDLSIEADTYPAAISSYMAGRTVPGGVNLVNIAKALDVSLDWLAGMGEKSETENKEK